VVVCLRRMNTESPENPGQGKIGRGARIQIGSPSKPDAHLALVLAELLAQFPEVLEAHLPQCFTPGSMSRSALVLMVVVEDTSTVSGTFQQEMCAEVSRHLAADAHLDIWYLDKSHSLLDGVRRANCQILDRSASGGSVILRPWSLWNRLRSRLVKILPGSAV
jgi:hypothetical protein